MHCRDLFMKKYTYVSDIMCDCVCVFICRASIPPYVNDPIQFLLRLAFASTRLLQILMFLLLSTASLMFIPCAVRSSFTLSIHFFGCLPLLLVPSTCPYSATTGSLFPSILVMCPNHVSLLFLILS